MKPAEEILSGSTMPDSIYANSGLPSSDALRAFKERPFRRSVRGEGVATALGVVTIVCALLGLAYNAATLNRILDDDFDAVAREHPLAHFYPAFYAMSAICVACYVLLTWGGCQLVRHRSTGSILLVCVWLFEIAYFFGVSALWLVPGVGLSIAGATGVADGGMMFQFVILLPIWGPLTILWLRKSPAPSRP